MRDELLKKTSQANECMVINLDHSRNPGTHWTCLFVNDGVSVYFDPFGLEPPREVIAYCKEPRYFSSFPIQKFNEVICGHLSIYMLHRLSSGDNFYEICLELCH
jgi:hypothetical protein